VAARGDGPSPTGRRLLVRRVVRIGWLVVLVIALAVALRSQWAEVSREIATLDPWRLGAACAAGVLGVGLSSGIWHAMLRGIGEPLPLPVSLRIFFVGQVGKYVPGAVWPAVTQAALARDHGVAPRASVAAVTLFIWVHLITGAALGIAVVTLTGELPLVVLAVVPALLALLTPSLLRWAVQHALRLGRREPLRRTPDGRHLLEACGWAALMWLAYGAHLQALTSAVDEPIGLIHAAGVFAAGWAIGFVLLVAPAGIGAREGAIVALLPLSAGAGLLVVLLSRLILTVADGVWAGLTALDGARARRRRRRAAARPRTDEVDRDGLAPGQPG
jgi:uncharacterized membrane protein YbhN (UPF0104 family)